MKMLPIAVSVAVSHFSGSALIGTPAEVYRYGTTYVWSVFCVLGMGLLGVFIYLPVFFKLQLTSIYEYLERRFDKRMRILGFIFYILGEILSFPIHVYTPALAFGTSSGFNVALTGFILFTICTIYTAVGGLRSVIWTDLLQFIIIITSLVTVCIIGLNSTGGFLSVWQTALRGERLDIFNFGFDFTKRDNVWALVLGGMTTLSSATITHQTGIQKFLTLPTYRDCVWSIICFVISFCPVLLFSVFIGLVCYAKYKDCDPLSAHIITKHDQMVPFFVTDVAGLVPGISGLLIAGVCSASLSSISSDLNALAAVLYKEYVNLFLKSNYSETSSSNILKLIVFVIGLLCACLVFAVDKLGDIFSVSLIAQALTKGPLLGLFTLGFVFPNVNGQGAFFGVIFSVILLMGLIVPSRIYQLQGFMKYPTKPLSILGCSVLNHTSPVTNSSFNTTFTTQNQWQPHSIFRMSFYIYPLIGFVFTLILGVVISCFTKGSSVVSEDLLSPANLSCLSKKLKRNKGLSYSSLTLALDKVEKTNK